MDWLASVAAFVLARENGLEVVGAWRQQLEPLQAPSLKQTPPLPPFGW